MKLVEPRWRRPDIEKTERNVRIVKLHFAGESMPKIGARFGITKATVRQILSAAGLIPLRRIGK